MTLSNFVITTTAIASRVEATTRPAIVTYQFLTSKVMQQRYIAAWNVAVFLFCLFVGLAVLTFQAGQKCSLLVDQFVQSHIKEETPCDPVKNVANVARDIGNIGKDTARQYARKQASLLSCWFIRQAERLAESVSLSARTAEQVVWAGVRRLPAK